MRHGDRLVGPLPLNLKRSFFLGIRILSLLLHIPVSQVGKNLLHFQFLFGLGGTRGVGMLPRNALDDVLIPLDYPSRVILGNGVQRLESSGVWRVLDSELLVGWAPGRGVALLVWLSVSKQVLGSVSVLVRRSSLMIYIFSISNNLVMLYFLWKHFESTLKLWKHMFLVFVCIMKSLRRVRKEWWKLALKRVEEVGETNNDSWHIVKVFERDALFADLLGTTQSDSVGVEIVPICFRHGIMPYLVDYVWIWELIIKPITSKHYKVMRRADLEMLDLWLWDDHIWVSIKFLQLGMGISQSSGDT